MHSGLISIGQRQVEDVRLGAHRLQQAGRVDYTGNEFVLDTNAGTWRANQLLVATGRTPNTEALNLEGIGVETARGATRGGCWVCRRW